MRKMTLLASALMLAAAACDASSPEDAVLSQVEPWNSGDIEAAMDLYTDDASVKITPAIPPGSPDEHRGKAELRSWFESLVAMGFEIDLEVVAVEGNTVTTRTKTWVDPTRELGVAPLVATEVYTVEDGKIAGWTWTLSDESLASITAATASPQAAAATEARVVFDGASCTYQGPATVAQGTEIAFAFEATAKPDDIALVVSPVQQGTTWEQTQEYAATNPAGSPAPFAQPGWRVLYGPGSMTITVSEAFDYAVLCSTSPTDTNENFAAGFIEVTET